MPPKKSTKPDVSTPNPMHGLGAPAPAPAPASGETKGGASGAVAAGIKHAGIDSRRRASGASRGGTSTPAGHKPTLPPASSGIGSRKPGGDTHRGIAAAGEFGGGPGRRSRRTTPERAPDGDWSWRDYPPFSWCCPRRTRRYYRPTTHHTSNPILTGAAAESRREPLVAGADDSVEAGGPRLSDAGIEALTLRSSARSNTAIIMAGESEPPLICEMSGVLIRADESIYLEPPTDRYPGSIIKVTTYEERDWLNWTIYIGLAWALYLLASLVPEATEQAGPRFLNETYNTSDLQLWLASQGPAERTLLEKTSSMAIGLLDLAQADAASQYSIFGVDPSTFAFRLMVIAGVALSIKTSMNFYNFYVRSSRTPFLNNTATALEKITPNVILFSATLGVNSVFSSLAKMPTPMEIYDSLAGVTPPPGSPFLAIDIQVREAIEQMWNGIGQSLLAAKPAMYMGAIAVAALAGVVVAKFCSAPRGKQTIHSQRLDSRDLTNFLDSALTLATSDRRIEEALHRGNYPLLIRLLSSHPTIKHHLGGLALPLADRLPPGAGTMMQYRSPLLHRGKGDGDASQTSGGSRGYQPPTVPDASDAKADRKPQRSHSFSGKPSKADGKSKAGGLRRTATMLPGKEGDGSRHMASPLAVSRLRSGQSLDAASGAIVQQSPVHPARDADRSGLGLPTSGGSVSALAASSPGSFGSTPRRVLDTLAAIAEHSGGGEGEDARSETSPPPGGKPVAAATSGRSGDALGRSVAPPALPPATPAQPKASEADGKLTAAAPQSLALPPSPQGATPPSGKPTAKPGNHGDGTADDDADAAAADDGLKSPPAARRRKAKVGDGEDSRSVSPPTEAEGDAAADARLQSPPAAQRKTGKIGDAKKAKPGSRFTGTVDAATLERRRRFKATQAAFEQHTKDGARGTITPVMAAQIAAARAEIRAGQDRGLGSAASFHGLARDGGDGSGDTAAPGMHRASTLSAGMFAKGPSGAVKSPRRPPPSKPVAAPAPAPAADEEEGAASSSPKPGMGSGGDDSGSTS